MNVLIDQFQKHKQFLHNSVVIKVSGLPWDIMLGELPNQNNTLLYDYLLSIQSTNETNLFRSLEPTSTTKAEGLWFMVTDRQNLAKAQLFIDTQLKPLVSTIDLPNDYLYDELDITNPCRVDCPSKTTMSYLKKYILTASAMKSSNETNNTTERNVRQKRKHRNDHKGGRGGGIKPPTNNAWNKPISWFTKDNNARSTSPITNMDEDAIHYQDDASTSLSITRVEFDNWERRIAQRLDDQESVLHATISTLQSEIVSLQSRLQASEKTQREALNIQKASLDQLSLNVQATTENCFNKIQDESNDTNAKIMLLHSTVQEQSNNTNSKFLQIHSTIQAQADMMSNLMKVFSINSTNDNTIEHFVPKQLQYYTEPTSTTATNTSFNSADLESPPKASSSGSMQSSSIESNKSFPSVSTNQSSPDSPMAQDSPTKNSASDDDPMHLLQNLRNEFNLQHPTPIHPLQLKTMQPKHHPRKIRY